MSLKICKKPLKRIVFSSLLVMLSACRQPASSPTYAEKAPPPTLEVTELPSDYSGADLENGRLHFNLCLSCHTIIKGGANMTGPNLYGVVGRKVASRTDYDYSDALKARTWIWDSEHLQGWLKSPQSYVPGTRMGFYGLHNDKDRLDTIAYLMVASRKGGF
jgi:cytochrome c